MRTSILLVFVLLTGCVQYEYSQFRSEEENVVRLKKLYLQSVQTCNGKDPTSHKVCTKEVEQELMARFDDRNKAFMTKADVARIIATQLIIEYQLDKASKASRTAEPLKSQSGGSRTAIPIADGPSLTTATTKITNRGVCFIPDFAPSVSLSSFTVISAVCR